MSAIPELIKMIKDPKCRTLILSGAGVSTDSGLPDFRSNNGLWNGKDPMEIASVKTLRARGLDESKHDYLNRINEFHAFYRDRIREVISHNPNPAHNILADWQRKGYVERILTQNVDGYHSVAGAKDVIELHGDITHVHCSRCGKPEFLEKYLDGNGWCEHCEPFKGVLRPNIVLFGEDLPYKAAADSNRLSKKANLIIAIGTSLQVSPANIFPQNTMRRGGRFVIINRESTRMDNLADIVINNEIGKVLPLLDKLVHS